MKQVIDWLNLNEYRMFPLLDTLTRPESFPLNFLLDLQLCVSEFSLDDSVVYLKQVNVYSSGVSVEFGTATQTVDTFSVDLSDKRKYPLYVRNPSGNLAVFGEGILNFKDSLSLRIPVEPGVCAQFNQGWLGVSAIAISPEKQSIIESSEPLLPLQPVDVSSHVVGDVKFVGGYNFRVDVVDNLIDLQVSTNYGLKMSCKTHFLSDIVRDCSDIVSYINGIPPDASGKFTFVPGSDITITPGTVLPSLFSDKFNEVSNEHSLFVGLAFQADNLCAPLNIVPSLV
jgi:hypothetical protein